MSEMSIQGQNIAMAQNDPSVYPQTTNMGPMSPYHTLGSGPNEAAPGDHQHLAGVTISGSRSSGAALVSIISALSSLGVIDGTSA
jgi:hypothetical protein